MIGFDSFIPVFDMIEDAKYCPNSLSLKLKRSGTSYGAGSPHYVIEPSLWTAHETKNTVREDLGLVMLDSIKTSIVFANSVRLLSFQLQHLRKSFLQKIPCIWMLQNHVKSMNVGLAPHLATSKLKILRGLCQGSRGSIHDPQLFQNWFSSPVNPIHQGICIFIISLCK